MRYSRKVIRSCEKINLVPKCLRSKHIKYCFQILGNSKEDENGRNRQILVLIKNNQIPIDIVILEFFFIF